MKRSTVLRQPGPCFATITLALVLLTLQTAWADETGEKNSPEEASAIAAIEKIGGTVRQVSRDTSFKDVDFHLSGTGLTDEGLAHVKQLKNVIWLNLKGTKITDAGLEHLKDMKSLKRLHLELTGIGDAGLTHLGGLEGLEYLNLYGTKVTDAGLGKLAGLKNLKRLYVWQTPVTEAGAAELMKTLPALQVVRGAKLAPVAPAAASGPAEKPQDEPAKTLATGRFVRVKLVGSDRILSLAEVQVFGAGRGTELHKAGAASQSSIDYGGEPGRAIDGNIDGDYRNNSVTHTKEENDPWWMVDLNAEQPIGRIVIHNRTDTGDDRLEGAVVEVLDAKMAVVYAAEIKGADEESRFTFEPAN